MSNHRVDASTEALHKKTSQHMAELIWLQFVQQYPTRLHSCDYRFRLRTAHALILRFYHIYFNRTHKHPTVSSEEWLIREVLNRFNDRDWPIVGKTSG